MTAADAELTDRADRTPSRSASARARVGSRAMSRHDAGPLAAGRTDGSVAIQTTDLRRSFGDFEAVAGVDLAVRTGEIYGFLGPNGAGKSTTVKVLCTLISPSGGTAFVAGHDVAKD